MCYSCGWDVPSWHTSATFQAKCHKYGHQEGFARNDAEAYISAGHYPSLKGKHKKMLPQPDYKWGEWLLGAGNIKEINVTKNNDKCYPTPTQDNNQADDETIRISNCKGKIENKIGVEIICNSTRVINKPCNNEDIGHTGTIDHFLKKARQRMK